MAYGHRYAIRHEAVVSTAITIIQLLAGTAVPFLIVAASLSQDGSTVSAQEKIAFVRKSAAATVTAGVVGTHVFKLRPGDPTPGLNLGTSATGVIASGEGTDTDVAYEEGFNVLAGWRFTPSEKEYIHVPGAGIIGLKFRTAPASQTWQMSITIEELG